jgi:NitT/TauT family transport system substrate-binding protein
MEDYGMKPDDIQFVVLPPPDMPTSLASGAIDAYFVGEPFCAKAELDGIGRILYYARIYGRILSPVLWWCMKT